MIPSYAVFVEKPPKSGENIRYTVMEISFADTDADIERKIAGHINEKRIKPITAGVTAYMIVTAETAQEAANSAKKQGLQYQSPEDMMRKKAAAENAEKFGTKNQEMTNDNEKDPYGFKETLDWLRDLFPH